MNLKILLMLYFILTGYLYAINTEDSNLTNPFPKAEVVKKNIPTAAKDENLSKWNISNWKNYFESKGADNSVIGNTQAIVGGTETGKVALSSNPNFLTTDAVKENKNLKDNPAVTGMDKSTQQEILSKSLNNVNVSLLNVPDSINCYITRDISFRWKCKYTGLTYGGAVDENGKAAKAKCINNCYEQKPCINVNPNSSEESIAVPKINCDFSKKKECSVSLALDKKRIVEKLIIDFSKKKENNNYLIDISLTKADGTTRVLNKDLRRDLIDNNTTINIREALKNINLKVKRFNDNNTSKSDILDVKLKYKKNDKWICRALQDINNIDGGNYGYSCPSGSVVTFNVGGRTYKICNNGGLGADNLDGTFSTESSCSSVCKVASECVPNFTTFTTDALKTFREGCIEGQSGCSNARKDCKVSRLKGDKILNEVVFDASSNKRITIQNGVQVKGVDRPRIDPGEDLSFQRRNEEEWKDKAFKDMAAKSKYSLVSSAIGDNTEAQNAYRMQFVSGASYGVPGTATRELNWLLKPKAFEVNNERTYYLYAVLVANLGYHDYNEYGNLIKKRKQIWYIKTSENDNFKAIKIGYNLGYSGVDDSNNTFYAKSATSHLDDKTFISNNWVELSTSQSAEYFKTIKFGNNDKPYWTFPIVSNVNNLLYMLPGIVRSITKKNGAYDIYNYTGKFDGSGDGMLNYSVYTYYSTTPLTYAQLYQKIIDKEAKKIYKQGEEYLYKRDIRGDGIGNDNIKLFQYGTADKTTVYTRILPNKEDIGKKGFIYVFIQ